MTTIETLRAALHPTRRRITEYLHVHGPTQVGTLATVLGEQVGSVSHHLRMLQRVGIVEQAPELATDGRTSWWRLAETSLSWSVDDFDAPADRAQATAAQRANLDYHLAKLAEWHRSAHRAPEEWRRAAFATDSTALASAQELAELAELLGRTLQEWRGRVEQRIAGGDAGPREPVFVFAHGFRTQP